MGFFTKFQRVKAGKQDVRSVFNLLFYYLNYLYIYIYIIVYNIFICKLI